MNICNIFIQVNLLSNLFEINESGSSLKLYVSIIIIIIRIGNRVFDEKFNFDLTGLKIAK